VIRSGCLKHVLEDAYLEAHNVGVHTIGKCDKLAMPKAPRNKITIEALPLKLHLLL
jgi:hypothetical protein